MGKEEDHLGTSLAHIVLCCVAGRGIGRVTGKNFSNPGMHANFFIHGVLGFLHFQSGILENDLAQAYALSYKATKYLALPCLMADCYQSDQTLCAAHLLSGAIPFVLALSGKDDVHLGRLMIACNIVSLCYYSHKKNITWGWYAAAASILAYCVSSEMKKSIIYPLALALLEDCAYRILPHGDAPSIPVR